MPSYKIIQAEIVKWAAEYSGERFHAVLCDPPYGIEFMGKSWDSPQGQLQDSFKGWGKALLPLLYPGALVFMFGGTRTWHRLAAGMEDAGFEMFDTITYVTASDPRFQCGWLEWMTGQGFPKSQSLQNFFCECGDENNSENSRSMLDVRNDGVDSKVMAEKEQGLLLQPELRQQGESGAPSRNRPLRENGLDRAGAQELPPENDWTEQPSMERRSDVLPQARELQANQIRPLPGGIPADGTEGRLRDGAPAGDGGAGRQAATESGSGSSCESRPAGQSARESGTVAEQSTPQAVGTRCGRCGKKVVAPAFRSSLKGYQTPALKPSHEPILCFKAPSGGKTYAELATEFGSGALNVDGGRIDAEPELAKNWQRNQSIAAKEGRNAMNGGLDTIDLRGYTPTGRYPANLAFECICEKTEVVDAPGQFVAAGTSDRTAIPFSPDRGWNEHSMDGRKQTAPESYGGKAIRHTNPECPAFLLDEQNGGLRARGNVSPTVRNSGSWFGAEGEAGAIDGGDSGGASRFFYCSKASRSEREDGLVGDIELPQKYGTIQDNRPHMEEGYEYPRKNVANNHPTVKPIDLNRWLASLLLPPPVCNRRILVPFAGVASEMIGCLLAGWDEVIGVEQSAEYC